MQLKFQPMQLKFRVAQLTSPGPRSRNEDSLIVREWEDGRVGVAVADGLGGNFGGDVASKLAVECVFNDVQRAIKDYENLMLEIHQKLVSAQKEDKRLVGMATTLTYGVFTDGKLQGGHCGDTRIVLIRGEGIKRITEDHTEVQRLLNAEKLTKEEALNYPRRHILEGALGSDEVPRFDLVDVDVQSGDRVLFSSDGVHEKILLREVFKLSQKGSSADDFILGIGREMENRNAEDNYTIVCVDVD